MEEENSNQDEKEKKDEEKKIKMKRFQKMRKMSITSKMLRKTNSIQLSLQWKVR